MKIKDLVAGELYALKHSEYSVDRVRVIDAEPVVPASTRPWNMSTAPKSCVRVVYVYENREANTSTTVPARKIVQTWAAQEIENAESKKAQRRGDILRADRAKDRLGDMADMIRKVGAVHGLTCADLVDMVRQTGPGKMDASEVEVLIAAFAERASLTFLDDEPGNAIYDDAVVETDREYGLVVTARNVTFEVPQVLALRMVAQLAMMSAEPVIATLDELEAVEPED